MSCLSLPSLVAQYPCASEWTLPHSLAQACTLASCRRPCLCTGLLSGWPFPARYVSSELVFVGDKVIARNLTPSLRGIEPAEPFILFLRKSYFWWQLRPPPFRRTLQCRLSFLSLQRSFVGLCFCFSAWPSLAWRPPPFMAYKQVKGSPVVGRRWGCAKQKRKRTEAVPVSLRPGYELGGGT